MEHQSVEVEVSRNGQHEEIGILAEDRNTVLAAAVAGKLTVLRSKGQWAQSAPRPRAHTKGFGSIQLLTPTASPAV